MNCVCGRKGHREVHGKPRGTEGGSRGALGGPRGARGAPRGAQGRPKGPHGGAKGDSGGALHRLTFKIWAKNAHRGVWGVNPPGK